MYTTTKKRALLMLGLAFVTSSTFAVPVFAKTNTEGQQIEKNSTTTPRTPLGARERGGMATKRDGIMGTVSSIQGTTFVVQGRAGFGPTATTTTTYTVDATNATVEKNKTASTVASIAVGDTVFVQGTVTNTQVVATHIRDGAPLARGNERGEKGNASSSLPTITGNGQPVIAGTVSAINGTNITVATQSNVTYTVDASHAQVLIGKQTGSLTAVKVGDMVLVQGTVQNTTVTASTIIDKSPSVVASGATTEGKKQTTGFFGGMKQFFSHLFGF